MKKMLYTKWKICFSMLLIVFVSCNEDFPNKLKENYPDDLAGRSNKNSKVLYLIIDGLRGQAINAENAPGLTQILKNATYTYNGLTNYNDKKVTNASAWADMLTGVVQTKHNIYADDIEGNNLETYPSFISHLKEESPDTRTAVISSSANFVDWFATDATSSVSFDVAASVSEALQAELNNEEAEVVLGHFNNVDEAGKSFGYDSDGYSQAIKEIDAYVNDAVNAIKSRPTFKDENWLVIIASNKGGDLDVNPDEEDRTAFGDPTRNTFVAFYSPKFKTVHLPKPPTDNIPYTGTSIKFAKTNTARNMAVMPDGSKYDIGSPSSNHTLQFKFKKPGGISYPIIISKQDIPETNGYNSKGWNIFLQGNEWIMWLKDNQKLSGGAVNDGIWHTITVVFNNDAKKVYLYTDGVKKNEMEINQDYSTTAPFRIGITENADFDYNITDIQIYNIALTDQEIAAYACMVDLDETYPLFDKLSGYWPATDGRGDVFEDRSGNDNPFELQGEYAWQTFNDISPNVCPPINDSFFERVPNNKDLPFQIFQWLGVGVSPEWQLDGKAWTPSYTQIRP